MASVRWDAILNGVYKKLKSAMPDFVVNQGTWASSNYGTNHVYLEYLSEEIGVGDEAQLARKLSFCVDIFVHETLDNRTDTRADDRDTAAYKKMAKYQKVIEDSIKEYVAETNTIYEGKLHRWSGDGGQFVPIYASRLQVSISYFETFNCNN